MKAKIRLLALTALLVLISAFFISCNQEESETAHEHSFTELCHTETCTKDGFVYYSCSCGAINQQAAAALGHDMGEISRTEATCISKGSIISACSKCSYQTVQMLEMLEHELSTESEEPSCTSAGSITTSCADCDYKTVEILGVCEHKLTTKRTEPSCTAVGSIVASCSECEYRSFETIEAVAHNISEERISPSCQSMGRVTASCSGCTYKTVEILDTVDHDTKLSSSFSASCTNPAKTVYKCSMCDRESEELTGEALGHIYDENFEKPLTYVQPCIREGCTYASLQQEALDNMAAFVKSIEFNGLDEDFIERANTDYYRVQFIIEDVGAYDPALHAYDSTSELAKTLETLATYFNDLWSCYEEAVKLYQYAMVQKDISLNDQEKFENYVYMAGYYQNIYSQYAGFWQKIYDSALREYAFKGWTEDNISSTLSYYNGYSNPEYVALATRQAELDAEIGILYSNSTDGIPDIYSNDRILDIYEEYVDNNNKIAQLVGGTNQDGSYVYQNGLYYSYIYNYSREYTPDDAEIIYDNIVEYIVPLYQQYIIKLNEITENAKQNWTSEQFEEYERITASFLSSEASNAFVNDFFKNISVTFGGESLTYYDAWQDMLQRGNLVIGELDGAYSGYLYGTQYPFIFLGEQRADSKTFVHEFGHYMESCFAYGKANAVSSFDLKETHSQGLEMLFLTYMDMQCTSGMEDVYEYYYIYDICTRLNVILTQISIDKFERAVYSDCFDGKNADIIMADGSITKDEYDFLYDSICLELNLPVFEYKYWRPNADRFGYCISYSVSMLASLQLISAPENFEERISAYTKLITYMEAGGIYTYKDVLEYAGLYSYDDAAMFEYLYDLLAITEAA